jgi:hypothetical protein
MTIELSYRIMYRGVNFVISTPLISYSYGVEYDSSDE